jgi:hypothetical protein
MNSRMTISVLLAGLLWGCDSTSTPQVVGTSSETATGVRLYLPSGAPAANARVQVFAVGDTGNLPVAQAFTDAKGVLAFDAPAKGRYNLVIRHPGGTSLLEDSLVSNGTSMPAWSDTLRAAGGVKGRVRVQPKDSPRIAWVHLLGSGIYANVDDSGGFAFGDVAPGRYTIEAVARDSTYTPTFRSARIWSDSTLDLGTIDLVYTGLPLVTGLAASYDTMAGTVTLHWNRSTDARVAAYAVYDGDVNSPYQAETVRTTNDTVLAIRCFASSWTDTTILHRTYRVGAVDHEGRKGSAWEVLKLDLPGPFRTGVLKIEWAKVGNATSFRTGKVDVSMRLDTLAGGLLMVEQLRDSVLGLIDAYALHRSGDGISWSLWMDSASSLSAPKTWAGKLWRIVPHVRDSLLSRNVNASMFGMDSTGPRYDSLYLLTADAGGLWAKVIAMPLPDSVNAASLEIVDGRLCILGWYDTYNPMGTYGISTRSLRYAGSTGDGLAWEAAPVDPASASSTRTGTLQRMEVVSGTSRSWTFGRADSYAYPTGYADNSTWVRSGVAGARETAAPLPEACRSATLIDEGSALLLIGDDCTLQSPASEPFQWKYLSAPGASLGWNHKEAVWNGKLVSINDSGVYLGTIAPR